MGCRRRPERLVCRRDFGSVCSRWGQYFFESSGQTTIALLMLGLKNPFLTLMKPGWPCESLCGTCGWLTQNGGFSGQVQGLALVTLHRRLRRCKTEIKKSSGFVSLHAEHICAPLESCAEFTKQQNIRKGKQRASPKLHPRRLGSAWKSLSSKNNIVIVGAVETDFLRLISAFPAQPSTKQNPNGFRKDTMLLKKLQYWFLLQMRLQGCLNALIMGVSADTECCTFGPSLRISVKRGEEFSGVVVTCWQV